MSVYEIIAVILVISILICFSMFKSFITGYNLGRHAAYQGLMMQVPTSKPPENLEPTKKINTADVDKLVDGPMSPVPPGQETPMPGFNVTPEMVEELAALRAAQAHE